MHAYIHTYIVSLQSSAKYFALLFTFFRLSNFYLSFVFEINFGFFEKKNKNLKWFLTHEHFFFFVFLYYSRQTFLEILLNLPANSISLLAFSLTCTPLSRFSNRFDAHKRENL